MCKTPRLSNHLNSSRLWAFIIIIIGILVRIVDFGNTPCGFNQDEAFAGYEAFSLANYGTDSAGYHNPCYFVSWGSGMNVLESYLAVPFIKLFGCSVTAIRLPMLILSCVSLVIIFLLLEYIFSEKIALIGLFLTSISPWHIMLSRWGLESNLAPALLLIGFYFFIRGVENNKFFIFSAIIYGACLYSYSITWLVVPISLVFFALYILFTKTRVSLPYVLISGGILFVLALPLILFLLVNKGVIPEISTNFFSVPKLVSMRESEISLKNLFLPESYNNLFNILIKQNDGLIWNSTEDFGLFYKLSLPFAIIGAVRLAATAIKAIRNKSLDYRVFVLLGLTASIFTCLLLSGLNVNKANSLHFYILTLISIGVNEIFVLLKSHRIIKASIICSYLVYFIFFCSFYFGSYNRQISGEFRNGLQSAVEYVKENKRKAVCVDSSVYHSQILFFDQTPTDVFISTVKYSNYPSSYLSAAEFGNYSFGIDYNNLESSKTYIAKAEQKARFTDLGFTVVSFDEYIIAYKQE